MITTKTDYEKQKAEISSGVSNLGHINGTKEELFTIDWNTRAITIPQSFDTIAVVGEHMAERLYFKCSRYFDDKDLSSEDVTFAIVYLSSDNIYGKDYAVDMKVVSESDDEIIFAWELKSGVTHVSGDLTFAIQAYSIDDEGKVNYRISTIPNSFNIVNTLEYVLSPSEPTAIDTLNGLAVRIAMLEKNMWNISNGNDNEKNIVLELPSDTEKRYGEISSLSLTLNNSKNDDYEAILTFTSGTTATQFTYPDDIKWTGTDVYEGVFAPVVNMRYTIAFWYDGVFYNAIVRGVDI